ncbi:MAG: MarR family transcriptional regulator [Bacteriovoracaceae bacterium]
MSRFQIMLLLYFEGPLSASELARRMLVTRGNISTFVKRLEADGQIEVCASSPSEKRPLYCLSDEAIFLFEELFEQHIKLVKKLVPRLEESFMDQLKNISEKDS